MTQRIFDIENEKDYADLWEILPDSINHIHKYGNNGFWDDIVKQGYLIMNIKWHDKTEITRPIQEATEQDVGKICAFWDNDGSKVYGLLSDLIIEESEDRKYGCVYGNRWAHARRLTRQEIEELI
jgi:hypothetical protein